MGKPLPEKVIDILKIGRGMKILDFGCGSGNYAIPIARAVGPAGKVYGVDKDIDELKRLWKRVQREGLINVQIILANENISLDKSSVDVVLLFDVLHHINDNKKLLENLYNMLKSNGILSVFPHYHFSREKLMRIVSRYNLFVLKDEYFDKALYNFKKME